MAVDHNNPQSRDEEILIATIDGEEYNKNPQSRMEELLLELKETIEEGGGGGGTNDYNDLLNQPSINNTTLKGDMSAEDLGLADKTTVDKILNGTDIDSFGDVESALAGKADLTDLAPAFSTETAYAVGKYVSYGGNIYKCTSAHSAGAWVAGDFTLVAVGSELEGKQGALTDGDYISIDAHNNISVNRELTPHQTSYRIKGTGQYAMNITKYIDGVEVSSKNYGYSQGTTRTIDDAFTINDTYSSDGYIWQFVWLRDSTTHYKDYTVSYRAYDAAFDFTEVFNDEDLSGYKLVIKSEMDTALADKADTDMVAADFNAGTSYTAGTYCIHEGKFYKFKNNHSGAWAAADVDEIKIAGELSSLKSGLTNVDVALSVPEGTGKNLLKVTASSTSGSGVTFTVNSDGTVSLNGTATDTVILPVGTFTFEANKSYVLSGCPSNGSTSTYLISIQGVGYDSGEGYIYTPTSDQEKNIVINIYSGTNVDGKVFSPMIRPATITDPTFTPYIPSVESRIEAVESGLINKVEMKTTKDLNSANTTGVYFFAYNAQNLPSPHSGTVLTLADVNGVIGMQIARVTTEDTVYVRFCDNSTWTAWKQLAFTS